MDKSVVVGFFVLAALTMSSMSVMGILQSSERVASSGIITRPAQGAPYVPPSSPTPPPPEPTVEIDVYADSGCTTALSSVVWGEITAGSSVHRTIYVKNNGETNIKVWFVVFSATQAGKWKLIRNPTAGTLVSAGTAITPVNLNTGSAKTLAITALKGADAQTVTNGSAGLVAYSGAGVFRPELAGSLLLSPGGSVAWTFQPAVAGDASVSLMVSQSIRSIHAKA